MTIFGSAQQYEDWLRKQLDDVVETDLAAKHDKMASDSFQFLRATYWRFAETICDVCPELKGAPHVLAVGDIHVENFGTWRDAEGRLVWGVNDYDEAARMPYVLDIVRLAASAMLAKVPGITDTAICDSIAQGYAAGIVLPKPFVLDRHHEWLRDAVVVTTKDRKKFWKKFDPARIEEEKPKKIVPLLLAEVKRRYRKAIEHAQPDRGIPLQFFAREAGTGSLGRRRIFGVGPWQGDLVVREAKAMLRSGWTLAHGGAHRVRCEEIAAGPYRSADPTYRLRGRVLVRRLSPNDFKIEAKPKKPEKGDDEAFNAIDQSKLINAKMLSAMGEDLAAVHRGSLSEDGIAADFGRRPEGWLLKSATAISQAIEEEQKEWAASPDRWPKMPGK